MSFGSDGHNILPLTEKQHHAKTFCTPHTTFSTTFSGIRNFLLIRQILQCMEFSICAFLEPEETNCPLLFSTSLRKASINSLVVASVK
jgi:hypothetical protein